MLNIEIEYVLLSKIKPNEYNPKTMSAKEAENLEKSILEFGIVDPLIVNRAKGREGIIIGGHQRYKIYQKLKYEEVPVIWLDIPDLKKEQELCLRLSKNIGSFDWDLLVNFNEELLKDIGFESEELDKIFQLGDIGDVDDVPEVRKTDIKQGDLFQLGKHRLLCGDATRLEDVERLMDGKKVDLVLTDPPYGINLNTDFSGEKSRLGTDFGKRKLRGKKYEKVIGDEYNFEPDFIFDYFNCKEIFLWGADYYLDRLPKGGNLFVWDKRVDEQMDKVYGSAFELCWSKNKHKREIIRIRWAGLFGIEKEDTKKRIHPTQKPVALAEWFITKFSTRGQNIIDLFGGSGSTLIACEQLNRQCYMIEIDPGYCQVIIDRWQNYTGQQAVLLQQEAVITN